MTEAPADLTTDKEHESSNEESHDSSVCDDSDFNDTECSHKEVEKLNKCSLMLVCF